MKCLKIELINVEVTSGYHYDQEMRKEKLKIKELDET